MNKPSLFSSLRRRMILIASLSPLVLGLFWIWSEHQDFTQRAEELRRTYLTQQKTLLRQELRGVVLPLLQSRIEQVRRRHKELVRRRAERGVRMIGTLAAGVGRGMDRKTFLAMVVATLRGMQSESGGYYVLADMKGHLLLYPPAPELEGRSLDQLPPGRNWQTLFRTASSVCALGNQGRFVEYVLTEPDGSTRNKRAYIHCLQGLGLMFGYTDATAATTRQAQADVLNTLQTIRSQSGGSFFAGTFDGIALAGPGKGGNLSGLTDVNGIRVVRTFISTARDGGGFVDYELPVFNATRTTTHRLSYVVALPGWQWYVGTGISLDDFNRRMEERREALNQRVREHIWIITGAMAVFILLGTLLTRPLMRGIARGMAQFEHFFRQASASNVALRPEDLPYQELVPLAQTANTMVDQRERAQGELRRLRTLLASAVDSMPSVLIAVDASMRVTLWNRRAADQLRVPQESALGRPLADVAPRFADTTERIRQAMRECTPVEYNRVRVEDEYGVRYEDRLIYPLTEHETGGAVVRIDDVTAEVRMQELLVQNEKMMSLGGLAAGMAHELNNPLGIILQLAQNFQRRIDPSHPANTDAARQTGLDLDALHAYMAARGLDHYLASMREAGSRAASIVSGMLEFSRHSDSSKQECDLNALMDEVLELAGQDHDLKKRFDFRAIDIERRYQSDLPLVRCSRNEIEQVLLNLVRNAAQAMHDRDYPSGLAPILTLRTMAEPDAVRLEIQDNGPGIPEADRRRIFEPFFTTKPPGQGTGLGLSVSYAIVTTNHSGTLDVEPVGAGGTRFVIRLPR